MARVTAQMSVPPDGCYAGPCPRCRERQTGRVSCSAGATPSDGPVTARGTVRLFNTAGGRVLCLAGVVDVTAVDSFLRRYGREPARVDGIDVRSVTVLSGPALDLLLDHLELAERTGRPVHVSSRSSAIDRLLADHRPGS
jgi:hypothetical protein